MNKNWRSDSEAIVRLRLVTYARINTWSDRALIQLRRSINRFTLYLHNIILIRFQFTNVHSRRNYL